MPPFESFDARFDLALTRPIAVGTGGVSFAFAPMDRVVSPELQATLTRETGRGGGVQTPEMEPEVAIGPSVELGPGHLGQRDVAGRLHIMAVRISGVAGRNPSLGGASGCDGLFRRDPVDRNGRPCFTHVSGRGALYFAPVSPEVAELDSVPASP